MEDAPKACSLGSHALLLPPHLARRSSQLPVPLPSGTPGTTNFPLTIRIQQWLPLPTQWGPEHGKGMCRACVPDSISGTPDWQHQAMFDG